MIAMPPQLEALITDMNRCIQAELYYPALLIALTLPEVCCGLNMPGNQFVKRPHYVAFIDKYTTPRTLGCDGQSCFHLRGGVVHRGNAANHPFSGFSHVIFYTPKSGGSVHGLAIQTPDKKAANFDLKLFCGAIEFAVREWFEEHKAKPLVLENMKSLLGWRPGGLSPFISGAGVVGCGP